MTGLMGKKVNIKKGMDILSARVRGSETHDQFN